MAELLEGYHLIVVHVSFHNGAFRDARQLLLTGNLIIEYNVRARPRSRGSMANEMYMCQQ